MEPAGRDPGKAFGAPAVGPVSLCSQKKSSPFRTIFPPAGDSGTTPGVERRPRNYLGKALSRQFSLRTRWRLTAKGDEEVPLRFTALRARIMRARKAVNSDYMGPRLYDRQFDIEQCKQCLWRQRLPSCKFM